MKWNSRLKAMQSVTIVTPEKQSMSQLDSAKECQNTLSSPFGTSEYGHTLKFNIESLTPSEREDYETILQERIAIMMFDGLLNEADATRIATEEVGSKIRRIKLLNWDLSNKAKLEHKQRILDHDAEQQKQARYQELRDIKNAETRSKYLASLEDEKDEKRKLADIAIDAELEPRKQVLMRDWLAVLLVFRASLSDFSKYRASMSNSAFSFLYASREAA